MSTRHIAAEDARLHDLTPEGSSNRASKRFRQKLAADGFTVDEGFKLKPGYLYTVVRAISARVNQNWDGWPSEELKKSYKTFIGKPVFVNHENHDPTKARGVVVAARYVENGMDKYIEVVQEIDAGRFPKLAHEIKTGGLDSVSMGAEAGFTICSYCHNKATDMDDMCDHVLNHKGKTLTRLDRKTGKKEEVLVFESCHKISFFELSYVFEPADETAVASKVVVAGKRVEAKPERCRNCGKRYDDWQGYCKHCDYDEDSLADHHDGMVDEWWSDPDDEQDPFDPRIIGASTSRPETPSNSESWHRPRNKALNDQRRRWRPELEIGDRPDEELVEEKDPFDPRSYIAGNRRGAAVNLSREVPYTGHNIPVSEGNYYRSLNVNSFDDLFDANGVMRGNGRGGTENLSFMRGAPLEMYTNGITKANTIIEGDSRLPISRTEKNGYSFVPQLDRASVDSGATPLRVWQRRAVGDSPIESVHDWEKVYDSFPANSHHAGKYTKEDFAAAGNRKPWETADDQSEEDVREIEAMLHKHSGECIPGVNCRGTGPAQGEQISKDSPNNPVNQKVLNPGGGGGGGGSASSSGYQGNGKSGRDGLNPAAQAFYDQLMADNPGASMGGFNPVVDQPWDEHATGDALDFMTSDLAQGNAIRDRALANGAKHVIWQQKLWYPGGGSEQMEDRGSPTENHYDHVHINIPTPSGFKPSTTTVSNGGGSSSSSNAGMMQATPTGLQPAQRAAKRRRKAGLPEDYTNAMYGENYGGVGDWPPPSVMDLMYDENEPPALPGEDADPARYSSIHHAAKFAVPNNPSSPDFNPKRPVWIPKGEVPLDLNRPVYVHYYIPAADRQRAAIQFHRNDPNDLDPDFKYDPSRPTLSYAEANRKAEQPDLWSVEQDGLVRGYTNNLHLHNADFSINRNGQVKTQVSGVKGVHGGVHGIMSFGHPREALEYSKVEYDPFRHMDFVHADTQEEVGEPDLWRTDSRGDQRNGHADHVHCSPDMQMHAARADNFGRSQLSVVFPPHPALKAVNADTVVPGWKPAPPHAEVMNRVPAETWVKRNQVNISKGRPPIPGTPLTMDDVKRQARKVAMRKIARSRAIKLAWGETEAPMAVDTLREEGSAPEDDNDDFERYVDPPKDLQTPDLSQAQQVDREQELQAQGGGMGEPGAADPNAGAVPQQHPQQQFITLQIPMPAEAPQVPQAAVPPQAQMGPPQMQQMMPPQGQPQQMVASQQSERKCPHCGIKQYDDNPHTDPLQEPQRGRCWKCSKPLNPHEGRITASMLDYFDRYFGRRVANWYDAIEAGRGMTPEETADYSRQAGKLSTLENGREHSTTNRNPTKGTAKMARSTNASRSKVADGPLVDGGDRSRNDQGEQEEAFISQTPPEGRAEVVTDDTQNISNTEHNLVARVQRGREQLLRDAKALAAVQRKRALSEAGGPTATVVDPRVNAGAGAEELTGDDFISADPNDGVVPTNPKDASLRAFAAFDSWLAQKTGKSSRRHTEASIKKAAAQFSREAGISPQALFPALGIVLREARKSEKQANTRGAKMRKRSNESLDVAAPDARIDVETPVKNTDAEAQASQFDLHDFGNNAGDNVANPDLSTDQNWAPGEASKTSAVKLAGGLLAMRCAEGMIAAGLEPNSRERKYQLAAEFERMNRGLIQDRVALLERFAAVRQADLRKVASGSSRGAARSPIPAGLGGGNRTASAGMRTAAHDPSNDSGLFI